MSQSLSLGVDVVQTIELAPELQLKLETKFARLQTLTTKLEQKLAQAGVEQIEDDIAVVKADLEDLRAISGYQKLDLLGIGMVTRVEPTPGSFLDEKKLLAAGVPLSTLQKCMTKKKATKPHTKITTAGAGGHGQRERDDDRE